MTVDTVTPIIPAPKAAPRPVGRKADLFAAGIAALGTALAVISAIWFFLGFAENDTRPEHLTSALVLTLGLFAFAVVPFACVAGLARRAYRAGTKRAHLFWVVFLMLPWIGLGLITVNFTPLPLFVGLIASVLAGLLSLWAIISLVLDWNAAPVNTFRSQQDEMPNAPQ